MNHGYADVSYEETPELIAAEKEAAIKNRLKLINLPASLKQASLAQVDLDDLGRLPVFEKLLASWSNIQLFEKVFTYMETLVWVKVSWWLP